MIPVNKLPATLVLLFLSSWALPGCSKDSSPSIVRLGTSFSTTDSGLMAYLTPSFEKKHPYKLKVTPKASGPTLTAAREGELDVVLVHARRAEDRFLSEGYGINRMDVMYNEFLLVGPPSDPAGIKGMKSLSKALSKIAAKQMLFLSRGDQSGTNKRELELWKQTGQSLNGKWYKKTKAGMLATLRKASAQKSYTLSDRASFLVNQAELNLEILLVGDPSLFNPYGVIAVNPAKVKGVNYKGAMAFVEFVTSPEGQKLIRDYGSDRFKDSLFQPVQAD